MLSKKKTVYGKLVTKVNNIDISGFVLKTKYDTDKSDLEKKISDAEKTILDTSGVVHDVSSLVKKQIIMLKCQTLKRKSLIMIMANIFLLQNLRT